MGVVRKRTGNTMCKELQTMVDIQLHRTLMIEQHEPYKQRKFTSISCFGDFKLKLSFNFMFLKYILFKYLTSVKLYTR